jgi:hypothetical protein
MRQTKRSGADSATSDPTRGRWSYRVGTDAIVTLVTEDPSRGTGRFIGRSGPVAW